MSEDTTDDTPQIDAAETVEVPENWDELDDAAKLEIADKILTDAASKANIEGTAETTGDAADTDAPRVFTDPDSVE